MKTPTLSQNPDQSLPGNPELPPGSLPVVAQDQKDFHQRVSKVTNTINFLDKFKGQNPLDENLARIIQRRIQERRQADPNKPILLNFNDYYEILLNKLSDQEMRADLAAIDNLEKHQAFFLKLFKAFRDSLLTTPSEQLAKSPELMTAIEELKSKETITYEQMLDIISRHPVLEKYSPMVYQEGIVGGGQVNAPFVHVYPHRLNPSLIPKLDKHTVRIYLSPTMAGLPNLCDNLMVLAFKKRIPLYFKTLDMSVNKGIKETFTRLDRVVIFTNEEHLEEILKFLEEFYQNNPQAFLDKNLPLGLKFKAGVTITPELTEEQKAAFPQNKSFNSYRAAILEEVNFITMQKILLDPEFSEVRPRSGRTFKQIFMDHLADSYSKSTRQNQSLASIKLSPEFRKMWQEIFQQKLELDSTSKHHWYTNRALKLTFADVAPNIAPSSMAKMLQASYSLVHKKYQTDPKNITFNS